MNLITATEVIDLAFTEKNFLPVKIKDTFIEVAQDEYLRPALGSKFYDALMAYMALGLASNAQGYKAAYVSLVNDYLKKPLAFWVKNIVIPDIAVTVTNTGIQQPTTTTSSLSTDKQRGELRSQALMNADALMNKTLRFIKENQSLFPDFEIEKVTTDHSGLGIWLRGRHKRH